jgi:hypothetical protein
LQQQQHAALRCAWAKTLNHADQVDVLARDEVQHALCAGRRHDVVNSETNRHRKASALKIAVGKQQRSAARKTSLLVASWECDCQCVTSMPGTLQIEEFTPNVPLLCVRKHKTWDRHG